MLYSKLTIVMLGSLHIKQEDRNLTEFPPQLTSALLALLALNLPKPVLREELIACLWPEAEPEEGRANLRQTLYTLRQRLETLPVPKANLLAATRTHLQLNPDTFQTDVQDFEQAARLAQQTPNLQQRIHLLMQAQGLYQGELLPGFYLDAILTERHRLARIHQELLQLLMQAYEQAGMPERAIEYGQQVVALNPALEEAHSDLMRLYAAAGQPAAIVRQYDQLTRVLDENLNTKPSETTRLSMETLRREAQSRVTLCADTKPGERHTPAEVLSTEESTPAVSLSAAAPLEEAASLASLSQEIATEKQDKTQNKAAVRSSRFSLWRHAPTLGMSLVVALIAGSAGWTLHGLNRPLSPVPVQTVSSQPIYPADRIGDNAVLRLPGTTPPLPFTRAASKKYGSQEASVTLGPFTRQATYKVRAVAKAYTSQQKGEVTVALTQENSLVKPPLKKFGSQFFEASLEAQVTLPANTITSFKVSGDNRGASSNGVVIEARLIAPK